MDRVSNPALICALSFLNREEMQSCRLVCKRFRSLMGRALNFAEVQRRQKEAGSGRSADPSQALTIHLPSKMRDLQEALFVLHRQIERQYASLPWPANMQNIVVVTQIVGGRGDIAGAAKAISLMQRICPTLNFDWILATSSHALAEYQPARFLNCSDPSKVTIRAWSSESPYEAPGDFLLMGPVNPTWGYDYIEKRINRKIAGPMFGFLENASDLSAFVPWVLESMIPNESEQDIPLQELYRKVHSFIFPSYSSASSGLLPMGVRPGTGVFLDPSRMKASLSRSDCCPSYLQQIQDDTLRKDILEAMQVASSSTLPNFDLYSFNSGYAHHSASWAKFIDCVAIHEKRKHLVVCLNQVGERSRLSTEEFKAEIFTAERLAFLQKKGYGTIILKAEGEKIALLQGSEHESGRQLTLIIRPSFSPNDMRSMQLASERMLATGDNSAVEAWCARSKLYLYEDVANCGCKWRFLQQQVDLARTISPNLGRLLELFGGDKRLQDRALNQPFSQERMAEVEKLLADPHLAEDTLNFCHLITRNYSFDTAFAGAVKRTAWHHRLPKLAELEADILGEKFRTGLIAYLKNPTGSHAPLEISTLSRLGNELQRITQGA